MSYATVAALRADCQELLRKFQMTDHVRFNPHFCNVWKEMNFGAIFEALKLQNNEMRMQFMEECYLLALSFCHPIHPFQYRTGGLYLLYSFYFKQSGEVKIRIVQKQWSEMEQFVNEAKEQNHHDIHYIFLKLVSSRAFHFVAHPRELAPFYQDIGTTEKDNFYALHSSIKEFCDERYFEQLQTLHQAYVEDKSKVQLSDAGKSDFLDNLSSLLKEFDNKSVDKLMSSTIVESIGSRRSDIKKSQLKNTGAVSHSRRHRAVELAEASASVSPRKRKAKRAKASATITSSDVLSEAGTSRADDTSISALIAKAETMEESSSQSMPMLTGDD